MTCALVWGTTTSTMAVNFGFVDKGVRDMSLIAPSKSAISMPYGTGIRYRRYAVFGKLSNVADMCSKLNKYSYFETLQFSANYAGKLPVYQTTLEGQTVLTTTPNGSPVAYAHPIPVQNSLPLLLMKNNDTGDYFLSTDPYAVCGKLPFTNPYPVGHAKYSTYQNRHVYQVYDGKTTWVSLLGFVVKSSAVVGQSQYDLLTNVVTTIPFVKGEKLDSNELSILVP
jgi:hypothetical protein